LGLPGCLRLLGSLGLLGCLRRPGGTWLRGFLAGVISPIG